MSKIYVPLNCCSYGDILAEDINNDRGVTLAAKNTFINEFIKGKLTDLNIEYVWLYHYEDPPKNEYNKLRYNEVRKDYKKAILLEKQLLNELSTGGEIDYQSVNTISEVVYKNIEESHHVAKCLLEIKSMDEYTYTHCVNVSLYSMLIAKWLNLPPRYIKEAIRAGLLHDIGKVRISDEILNKKGRLTKEEFDEMKKHSLYGYEMIKEIPEFSERVKYAVLSHHERIDGSGYPNGLTGSSFDLFAKIVAVADVYDAMTQNRVYRAKLSPFETFQMFLTIGLGTFDTMVLNAFLKHISAAYIDSSVLLNNGDKAKIVYIPPQDIISPVVSIGTSYIDLSKENDLKVTMIL